MSISYQTEANKTAMVSKAGYFLRWYMTMPGDASAGETFCTLLLAELEGFIIFDGIMVKTDNAATDSFRIDVGAYFKDPGLHGGSQTFALAYGLVNIVIPGSLWASEPFRVVSSARPQKLGFRSGGSEVYLVTMSPNTNLKNFVVEVKSRILFNRKDFEEAN